MAAPFGCWKDATSMPLSIVLLAVAIACSIAVDMCTAEPGRALPVPVSGPERSWSSRGEWPSAGPAAGSEDDAAGEGAGRLLARRCVACGEPPATQKHAAPSAPTATAAQAVMPTRALLAPWASWQLLCRALLIVTLSKVAGSADERARLPMTNRDLIGN